MNALRTLASSALLGTERRAPDWPAFCGGIGEVMNALSDQPPEERLLRVAGVIGTCHLAGWLPEANLSAEGERCERETLEPLTDERFEQALVMALDEGPQRLQAEAMTALAKAGCVLPPRLLPKALDAGSRSVALRSFLLPVLGRRGAWLAKQNENWTYATGAASEALDPDLWEHGGLEQRKLFLRALRTHEAGKTRELVMAAMTSEGARERAALLEETKTGLSLDDQDMLESALRDKSKEVRETAVRLLGSLTGSRFAQRMEARLAACLKKEKKFLRGEVITLEPPTAFAAEWKADLMEEAVPQGRSLGGRAWWLFQMVRRAPLLWWEKQTGMKPADLLAWAAKSDWADALLQGWAIAQSLQTRADWAAAFLDSPVVESVKINRFELLDVLPPGEREKHLLSFLQNAVAAKSAISPVLDRGLQTMLLGAELHFVDHASHFLRLVKNHLQGGNGQYDWALRASLVELACVLPRSLFDDAQQDWDLARPELQPFVEAIARFHSVLDARKIIQSLKR